MKILFLHRAPLWGSGSGTYVRKLAEEFVKENQVAIVAPEKKEFDKIKIYQVKTPFPGVFYSHPEYPKARRYSQMTNQELTSYLIPYLEKAMIACEEFKPDILFVQHASFLVWVADYLKDFYNIPFTVAIHGPDLNSVLQDRRLRLLTKHSIIRASRIFPNSFDTKNRFYSIFGEVFRRKTRTIFPGVDLKLFPKDRNVKMINQKYHLAGKKLVIFVGRIDKEKGIEYLIKAAENIKAEIYILGSGEYKTELIALAKKLKLENVHFVAHFGQENLTELREFYQRADVVVVPSTVKEALGLVILEAMACSTPVVASNIGGIPNIVKEGKTGFLVKPRSASEIAEKVNKIVNDEKLRMTMGDRCRKFIEEKFTWEKAARSILDNFERLLKHVIKKEEGQEWEKLFGWFEP